MSDVPPPATQLTDDPALVAGIASCVLAVAAAAACFLPRGEWVAPLLGIGVGALGMALARGSPRYSRAWPMVGTVSNAAVLLTVLVLYVVGGILAERRREATVERVHAEMVAHFEAELPYARAEDQRNRLVRAAAERGVAAGATAEAVTAFDEGLAALRRRGPTPAEVDAAADGLADALARRLAAATRPSP